MSKNYLFKHIECSNSSGFAAEDFYISRHDDRKDDGGSLIGDIIDAVTD